MNCKFEQLVVTGFVGTCSSYFSLTLVSYLYEIGWSHLFFFLVNGWSHYLLVLLLKLRGSLFFSSFFSTISEFLLACEILEQGTSYPFEKTQ